MWQMELIPTLLLETAKDGILLRIIELAIRLALIGVDA